MLLEIKAVHFNAAEPFSLASAFCKPNLYRLPQG